MRFWCDQLHRWDWENLEATRIGKKLEAEAKAAAIKLMRASVARSVVAMELLQKQVAKQAAEVDACENDWSEP